MTMLPWAGPILPLQSAARLVLLDNARDADGEPRVALMPPGPRGVPIAFPTIADALAALRQQEAAQHAPVPR